ncbi:hypothetical protein R5W24_005128 [Gemmata sp. JC717]|uniref:hypothetical protein n=1 Tax=Gemmata algarum TaxID=2975278 RepID=UPI0021BBB616|nr:hypothetical protein [Gemmata algarum]MDY3555981.1 hypothetical protein [Gemmata algarum]
MPKPNADLKRAAKATTRTARVRLSQIVADHEQEFCHRLGDALAPESLTPLAENLVSEGQQVPLTVYDSGRTDRGQKVYVLIGGFRRFHAIRKAIHEHLDAANIRDEMEVDVTEVVRGPSQSEEDFHRDLLVRSVGENEQRKNFTTEEKLAIVKQFEDGKVPAPRAASALAISQTQYDRFRAVVSVPWLHAYVAGNCLGMTDAAELIAAAKKHNWVEEFREDFDQWVAEKREFVEQERQELAKVGKKLSGPAEHVKKFADRKLVQHWAKLIEQRQRFGGRPQFQFGIAIDKEKKTIIVPGRTFRSGELSAADMETMIAELQDAVTELIPLYRERQVIEEARNLSDEDRQRELTRILENRRRQKEAEARANAGRPAGNFGKPAAPNVKSVETDDEAPADDSDAEGV